MTTQIDHSLEVADIRMWASGESTRAYRAARRCDRRGQTEAASLFREIGAEAQRLVRLCESFTKGQSDE